MTGLLQADDHEHTWQSDPTDGIWQECMTCQMVRRRPDRIRQAEQAREAAIAAVERHATVDDKEAAWAAVQQVARQQSVTASWTSDLVLDVLSDAGVELPEPRLLGPVMRRAERAGLIEPVVCPSCHRVETALSARPSRHRAPQRLWRSKRHRP